MLETILCRLKHKKQKLKELENKIDNEVKEVECLEKKSKAIHGEVGKVNLRKIENKIAQLREEYSCHGHRGYDYIYNKNAILAINKLEEEFIKAIIEE